jgi:hypothetical protein
VAAYNHPSGRTHPSPEGRVVTSRLMAAGETVDVRLLDVVRLRITAVYNFKGNPDFRYMRIQGYPTVRSVAYRKYDLTTLVNGVSFISTAFT